MTEIVNRRVISFGRRPPQQSSGHAGHAGQMPATAAVELTRRVLSFRPKNAIKDENTHSNGRRNTLQAVGDISRVISFGKHRKHQPSSQAQEAAEHRDVIREVALHKASASDVLGVTLYTPVVSGLAPEGDGVMVAQVQRDGIAARKVQPGDLLLAINGVAVADHKVASDSLKAATGVIQLVLAPARPLPDGWKTRVDAKGEVDYVHRELNVHLPFHPAGLDVARLMLARGAAAPEDQDETAEDSEDLQQPLKALRASLVDSPRRQLKDADAPDAALRWRKAFHKVSMVNLLTGETEPRDRRSLKLADGQEPSEGEGGVLPREPAVGMLQHERV